MSEVTVYWSCSNKESLRAEEPFNVIQKHIQDVGKEDNNYLKCPAFRDTLSNVYGVGSIYDFDFVRDVKQKRIASSLNDIDELITLRDSNLQLISINTFLHLFTEEDGIEVTQTAAFLEDSKFVRDTITIPGKMDISKWYRPLEQSFRIRNGVEKIDVGLGDPVFYISFNTDKKIKFVRYEMSERCKELAKMCVNSNKNKRKASPLSYYYGLFKKNNYKDKVLKEIKKNIV